MYYICPIIIYNNFQRAKKYTACSPEVKKQQEIFYTFH